MCKIEREREVGEGAGQDFEDCRWKEIEGRGEEPVNKNKTLADQKQKNCCKNNFPLTIITTLALPGTLAIMIFLAG